MTSCVALPPDAPVLRLTVVGSGEPLLRLEKRLSCAAAGAGIALRLDVRKDPQELGFPFEQTPVVLLAGQIIFQGLPRTEEIEAWLRETLHTDKQTDEPRP